MVICAWDPTSTSLVSLAWLAFGLWLPLAEYLKQIVGLDHASSFLAVWAMLEQPAAAALGLSHSPWAFRAPDLSIL